MLSNEQVQSIAKQTMEYLKGEIYTGQPLSQIRQLCENKMYELGADSFWYYNIGAFVFSGEDTAVSVSGRKYHTPDRKIQNNDIITIDLSPQCKHIWGDYARTVIIENGKVIDSLNEIKNDEWRNSLLFEQNLHQSLFEFVNDNTTFEDIYYYINDLIEKGGYVNLDFKGNLGHSINRHMFSRIYIEKGNKRKISSVRYFTFEPHISIPDSKYGFKREDIYSFQNGRLLVI
ncbi:MAG: aminopeptidase P family protein [Eubacterium sp.]|nr:aminopeptidase P family protein [Eubacterium sp.]